MAALSKPPTILSMPEEVFDLIFKFLNPIEIFQFSRVSLKTKEISMKSAAKKGRSLMNITVMDHYKLELKFLEESWHFLVFPNSLDYEEGANSLSVRSENPGREFSRLVDQIREVFKAEIGSMYINIGSEMTTDDLNGFMKCLDTVIKIPEMTVNSSQYDNGHMNWFMENLKKDIGKLYINERYQSTRHANFKFQGKIDDLNAGTVSEWLDFDQLKSLSCRNIYGGLTTLSNQDLNLFLKNWSLENHGNERIGFYMFQAKEKLEWSIILEGLEGEVRDVKTVKRDYKSPWHPTQMFHINGGVDIKRADGKTATVGMRFHVGFDEEPLTQKAIDQYEKIIKNRDSEEEEEEEEDVVTEDEDEDSGGEGSREFKLTTNARQYFFMVVW
ncbi:hypothetical protein GCK72_011275 [Caenorhabditis remanei]|uniref:F-box domain-containing protein n=1 Tax=Caenorhabditis remanei TaxID=31234 RepID=A0A6A5H5A6_CAERE|nr:hypothetical protein GCK72_011275 [Caenorhabditis remanei]KAF1763010.1 hypothetical protein GCK72_011275 [Caenorhabditis remanei]